jgi:16S rRNA (cytidine1402-2'-O)-methyltransferase
MTDTTRQGTLYIVATPIGNLDDITLRAIETLKQVDMIACEDTRHTGILLNRYNITKKLTSYFEHNKVTKAGYIIRLLQQGQNIALVSDAGTPGINDPGYRLIKDAINNNIQVVPIPGANAAIAALSASGMPTDRFAFEGFLPVKTTARKNLLLKHKQDDRTMIYYESPHRLLSTLKDMQEILAGQEIVVAREITKKFEEIKRGVPEALLSYFKESNIKGEFVIIFNPKLKKQTQAF